MDIVALIISIFALIGSSITACAAKCSASAAKCSADAAKRNVEIIEIRHIKDILKPLCGSAVLKEKLQELRDKMDKEILVTAMASAVREEERYPDQAKKRIKEYTEIIYTCSNEHV